MMNTDHEHPPIEDAAKWLAENGPGLQAVTECKQRFGLTVSQLPEICVAAARIRREKHGWGSDG